MSSENQGQKIRTLSILVFIPKFYHQQEMKWRPIFIFIYESERNKKKKEGEKEFIVTILNQWITWEKKKKKRKF